MTEEFDKNDIEKHITRKKYNKRNKPKNAVRIKNAKRPRAKEDRDSSAVIKKMREYIKTPHVNARNRRKKRMFITKMRYGLKIQNIVAKFRTDIAWGGNDILRILRDKTGSGYCPALFAAAKMTQGGGDDYISRMTFSVYQSKAVVTTGANSRAGLVCGAHSAVHTMTQCDPKKKRVSFYDLKPENVVASSAFDVGEIDLKEFGETKKDSMDSDWIVSKTPMFPSLYGKTRIGGGIDVEFGYLIFKSGKVTFLIKPEHFEKVEKIIHLFPKMLKKAIVKSDEKNQEIVLEKEEEGGGVDLPKHTILDKDKTRIYSQEEEEMEKLVLENNESVISKNRKKVNIEQYISFDGVPNVKFPLGLG